MSDTYEVETTNKDELSEQLDHVFRDLKSVILQNEEAFIFVWSVKGEVNLISNLSDDGNVEFAKDVLRKMVENKEQADVESARNPAQKYN